MSLWKQAVLIVALLAAAAGLSAAFLPVTHPMLGRIGLLAPLDRLGLVGQAEPVSQDAPGRGRDGPARVVAVEPQTQLMSDVVTAIGTARSAHSVILSPEVSGRVTSLNVASGDYVTQGEVIAELDAEAARIAVDRAALVLRDAQATHDRVARLRATGAATELQSQEADLALKTAELELREAEFDLSRHQIVAPIAGWVGILTAEVGNQVAPNVEITRIEDRSSLVIDFRVPERIVSRLRVGDPVRAAPLADPGVALAGAITALDNRVDEVSRTLQVQAAIENDADRMRPGMAFQIYLTFTGDTHPAVDPLAIQWGTNGAFIWAVREGKAARVPVRILQRNSDSILIDAALLPDDLVVTEGVQALRPDGEVVPVSDTAETKAPKS